MNEQLLMATGNPGKIEEIKAILSPLNFTLLTPQEAGIRLEIKETGLTYAKNAQLKALAYLRAAQIPVLADDSGLEVDVLDGAPGVFSARYSPKQNANDADRRGYLLEQLKGKPQPWKAQFKCTAILALPDDRLFTTTGSCKGVIIPEERGTAGFGYDPVFYIPEYGATMAEMGPDIKNNISHRADALLSMIQILRRVLI